MAYLKDIEEIRKQTQHVFGDIRINYVPKKSFEERQKELFVGMQKSIENMQSDLKFLSKVKKELEKRDPIKSIEADIKKIKDSLTILKGYFNVFFQKEKEELNRVTNPARNALLEMRERALV